MFMSIKDYLARITHTLEHVVAPAIESEFERGQVLASVFLLDQLLGKVEYKQELVMEEIIMSCKTMTIITDYLEDTIGVTDDLISGFLQKIDQDGLGKGIDFLNQCDEMLRSTIDFFFRHRSQLSEVQTEYINDCILDYLGNANTRELSMFKMSTVEQYIHRKD